jgi:hypothetical protein
MLNRKGDPAMVSAIGPLNTAPVSKEIAGIEANNTNGEAADSRVDFTKHAGPEKHIGQGYLGRATPEWANKALAVINATQATRGTGGAEYYTEGNRTAFIVTDKSSGNKFLSVSNTAIPGKNVDTQAQFFPLMQNGNGGYRLKPEGSGPFIDA